MESGGFSPSELLPALVHRHGGRAGGAAQGRAGAGAGRRRTGVGGAARTGATGVCRTPDRVKPPTRRPSSADWPFSEWVAAAVCSTMAAFCWVTWSIWFTAILTWCRPSGLLLGRRGDARSPDRRSRPPCRRCRCSTSPVWPTRLTPASTWSGRGRDQVLDLLGGVGRSAAPGPGLPGRTTAKPRPALARTGRLDPGVQRQQVGLEGDLVDHAKRSGRSRATRLSIWPMARRRR